MKPLNTKSLIIILMIVIPLLIVQATWIFRDAKKRGENYYWLWGLFGLINVPESLLVYLLVTRVVMGRKNKN